MQNIYRAISLAHYISEYNNVNPKIEGENINPHITGVQVHVNSSTFYLAAKQLHTFEINFSIFNLEREYNKCLYNTCFIFKCGALNQI